MGTCISEPPSMLLVSQLSFCDWSRAWKMFLGPVVQGFPPRTPNLLFLFLRDAEEVEEGGEQAVFHIVLLGCAFLVTETSCGFPWTVTPAVVGTVVDNITARVSAFLSMVNVIAYLPHCIPRGLLNIFILKI